MSNEKYNGWTNYATWRVNVEIVNDIDLSDVDYEFTADMIKEIVEDVVFSEHNFEWTLMKGYAQAFLDEVNYYEIAHHLNEYRKEIKQYG
jgi:hypothetical protein